jgi:hypothetical protein
MAVEVQQVEREIGQPVVLAGGDRLVQRVDVGHAALVRYRNLAVEHHRRQFRLDQGAEGLLEERRAVDAVTADQPQRIGRDDGNEAVPIVLDLMQPAITVRRRGAGGNDLEVGLGRQGGRDRRTGQGKFQHSHGEYRAAGRGAKSSRTVACCRRCPKFCREGPMTLGNALRAKVRLLVWCKKCGHRTEPDVATQVAQQGAEMLVTEWARLRRCAVCDERGADFAVSGDRLG